MQNANVKTAIDRWGISAGVWLCLLLALLYFCPAAVLAPDAAVTAREDAILTAAGMPRQQADRLDRDVKAFIAETLEASGQLDQMTYISSRPLSAAPEGSGLLSEIEFQFTAFQAAGTFYLFPSYTFTETVRPSGDDCLTLTFGEAFQPYEYAGRVWYKEEPMRDWEAVNELTANLQDFAEASYTGSQLGKTSRDVQIKGCAAVCAAEAPGEDQTVAVTYTHNPGWNADFTLFLGPWRWVFPADADVRTASQTVLLSD